MNSLVFLDLNSISNDDLPDEYKKLFETYQQMKKVSDDDKQQLYELQSHLKTAKAAESHLSQELEIISSVQNSEIEKIQSRYQHELDDLKRVLSDMKEYRSALEQNVEDLTTENTKLKEKIEELSKNAQKNVKPTSSNGNIERELKLEKENLELLSKLDEFQENIQKSMMIIAERESHIEVLKEQIQCLEENLSSKREELEEKTSLLESTQEQIIETNAEIALLKSAPENHNHKGNSLFAEVDDQRKMMKQVLAAQKKNYLHMKKIYNESEHEIRRLKRENSAMHNELQTCSAIFLNSNKTYKEKLNERISQLLKQNDELQGKLKWTEERLISMGAEKGINWLDSILIFCKNETKELKDQLYTCRMQKALLDRNYQNSQEDYAKWRFEALKSRCIIIDRESLLDENGLKYKNFHSNDFQFSEKELENASPKISFGKRRSILEHLDNKTAKSANVQNFNKQNNNSMPNTPEIKKSSVICSSAENSIIEILDSPQNFTNIKNKSHQKEISGENFFEIYEDTSTFMPSSTSTNIKTMSTGINMELGQYNFKNSENENKKLMLPINNNNNTDENKCPIKINKDKSSTLNSSLDGEIKNNNNLFEIYEDTTRNCLPLVKSTNNDENLTESFVESENKENNQTLKCIKGEDKIGNSSSSDEKTADYFEIYEDTTKLSFPLVKLNSKEENINENKENQTIKNELENDMKIYQNNTIKKVGLEQEAADVTCAKNVSKSILVKEKDIITDDFKYVKFDEKTIKKENKSTVKVITKRTQSNVVIRHIVFGKPDKQKK